MDINTITNLISAIGFPIVMCLVMAWYIKYISEKNNDTIAEIMKNHAAESSDFKAAIDNNTKAIEALTAKVDLIEKGAK